MIKFLVKPQYNWIDLVSGSVTVLFLADEKYWDALIAFLLPLVLTPALKVAAYSATKEGHND
jgi:hypothetical protein